MIGSPEGCAHQRGFREPGFEIVATAIRIEQRVEIDAVPA